MTAGELAKLAADAKVEADRFHGLTASEVDRLPPPLREGLGALEGFALAIHALLRGPVQRRHVECQEFEGLREVLPIYRKHLDRIIAARPRTATN